MKRFYLAAIAMALLLSACGGPAAEVTPTLSPAAEPTAAPVSTPTPTPDPTPAPTAVVLVAPELTEQRFRQAFTAEDGTVVLSVDYALPHVVNYPDSAALLAIDDRYTQMGAALLDNAASTAQDAVSDYEVSLQAGLPFQPTIEEMSYEVTFLSERVLSVSRTFYAAAAEAAHPTVLLLGDSFDLRDGRRLTFGDLCTDVESATQAALEAVCQSEALAGLERQAEEAFQPDQFYLTDTGFTFWFQPGELGASNSPIEVEVPYEALEGYLVEWLR